MVGGGFGRQVTRLMGECGLSSLPYRRTREGPSYAANLAKFIQTYEPEALFQYIPVRRHRGIEVPEEFSLKRAE